MSTDIYEVLKHLWIFWTQLITIVSALHEFLVVIGPQLRHLTLRHPMTKLPAGALDNVLEWCPNLIALRVSADYISDALFENGRIPKGHPLRILDLDCSPSAGVEVGIMPDSIWLAIDGGVLQDLRSIRVNARLAWLATESLRTSVSDLIELVRDQEKRRPLGVTPGVYHSIEQ